MLMCVISSAAVSGPAPARARQGGSWRPTRARATQARAGAISCAGAQQCATAQAEPKLGLFLCALCNQQRARTCREPVWRAAWLVAELEAPLCNGCGHKGNGCVRWLTWGAKQTAITTHNGRLAIARYFYLGLLSPFA